MIETKTYGHRNEQLVNKQSYSWTAYNNKQRSFAFWTAMNCHIFASYGARHRCQGRPPQPNARRRPFTPCPDRPGSAPLRFLVLWGTPPAGHQKDPCRHQIQPAGLQLWHYEAWKLDVIGKRVGLERTRVLRDMMGILTQQKMIEHCRDWTEQPEKMAAPWSTEQGCPLLIGRNLFHHFLGKINLTILIWL